MSKLKSLVLCILSAFLGIGFYINDHTTPIWAFLIVSALLFSIWIYKYLRDRSNVTQAQLERETATPISSTPPKESSGSRFLTVPPPLK